MIKFQGNNFHMRRKNKHCLERKKRRSGSNRTLIHSNVSNRMILIHSNVSKSFKKQRNNTLYCFANRSSLDKNSDNMDEKFFLKKIEVTRCLGRSLHLTTTKRQSKEWICINREHFFKSYKNFLVV